MSESEIPYELIDQYLRGELSGDEMAAFEAQLKSNQLLHEEFAFQKAMYSMVEVDYLTDISKAVRKEIVGAKSSNTKKKIVAGASVVVVALLAGYFLLVDKDVEDEKKDTPKIEQVKQIKAELVDTSIHIVKEAVENIETKIKSEQIVVKENSKGEIINKSISTPTEAKKPVVEPTAKPQIVESIVTVSDTTKTTVPEKVGNVKKDKPIVIEKVDPCKAVELPKVKLIHPNLGSENGAIQLENAPEFTIYLKSESPSQSKKEIVNLEAGNYTVQAQNSKGCIVDLGSYTLTKQACATEKSYIFESRFEPTLDLPINPTKASRITIFTKKGELVYDDKLIDDSNFSWDRSTLNGSLASAGMYIVIIETETFKPCKYSVVITE